MEVMGVVGVMVNCALIGMSGPVHRLFPNISTAQTVLLIIVLEVRGNKRALLAGWCEPGIMSLKLRTT